MSGQVGCARDIERLDDLHGRDRNHAKDAGRAQTERIQNGEPADEGAQTRRIGAAHVAAPGEKCWRFASSQGNVFRNREMMQAMVVFSTWLTYATTESLCSGFIAANSQIERAE